MRTGKWARLWVLAGAVMVAVTGCQINHQKDAAAIMQKSEPSGMPGEMPVLQGISLNKAEVPRYDMLEITVDLEAEFENPYDPEQIDLSATFTSPGKQVWQVNGFYDGAQWKIRLSPNEVGAWRYQVSLKAKGGTVKGPAGKFTVTPSAHHGWIRVSPINQRYFAYDDGTSFYGVGMAYPWNVTEEGLERIRQSGGNIITYWNGNYDNAGNGGGTRQLESLQSGIGYIDQQKSSRIDELISWCRENGIHLKFVIWPHDSLADQIDWPRAWDRNPLNDWMEAADFYSSDRAWKIQQDMYRYILARWGYSPTIAIWDIVCEINGTDGWQMGSRKAANDWIVRVQDYFAANDPYRHPTSGSMAGGMDDKWDHGYRTTDLSDREIYFHLQAETFANDIAERWKKYRKPLVIGETGNVTDAPVYHNALWASLSNGLAMTPLWWAYDQMDNAMFEQMKSFAAFVSNLSFADGDFDRAKVKSDREIHAWAMAGSNASFGWLMQTQTGGISGAKLQIDPIPEGAYLLRWFDTWTGTMLAEEQVNVQTKSVKLTAPDSLHADIAFLLQRQ